jgi:hypothetical protein
MLMERVEMVGGNVLVMRTRQLGPNSWCCDLYERHEAAHLSEEFLFEEFGESENEAIAMALADANDPSYLHSHHSH